VSHLDLAVDTVLNYHALVRPGRVLTGPQHRIAASLAAATAEHYEALVAAATDTAAVRMWTTAANKAHDTAARHELAAHLIAVSLLVDQLPGERTTHVDIPEQQCNQRWCTRPAVKDGMCEQCWTAVFGGVL
jgi:hypothetical protein